MTGFFLIFWAVFFGGVPLIFFVVDIAENGFFAILSPILLFPTIGLIVFIIGCKMVKKYFKIKNIEKTGTETTGYFISMDSNTTVNNVPRYFINFAFKNEEGKEIHTKTSSKYLYNEAKYYEIKKQFKVKFRGELAAIVEKPAIIDSPYYTSENNAPYITNPTSWKYQDGHLIKEKEYYYVCEYCGSSQKKLGKCKSCGARITEKSKREVW